MPKQHAITGLTALIAGAFFMEFLDGTIIATALPEAAHSFHVGAVGMNLGMTAYLLTLAVCIPISGWVADRVGARTVFASAVGVFTLASVLCGLAGTLPEFTALRVLQGVGGAMMVPVGRLVVLRVTPPERLTEAIIYMQWPGLSALVLGPPLGGLITTYANWRFIFFLNLPLGIVATVLALRWIENVQSEERPAFDWLTFVLAGIASTTLVYALELGTGGGHTARASATFALSLLSGGLAVLAARRRPGSSLIDLHSLRKPTFAQAVYGASAFRVAVSVLPFLLPLMFQLAFGLSAFRSGLYLLALFGGDVSMKALVVPVLRRWGFRQVMLGNGVLTAISLALCATLTPATPVPLLLTLLCVHGALRSLEFTCMGTLAFADISSAEMSRANGFLSAVMQLGMGLGVPVAALSLRWMARGHGHGMAAPTLRDFHGAILLAALLALGPVLNALHLPDDAGAATSGHRSRRREAANFGETAPSVLAPLPSPDGEILPRQELNAEAVPTASQVFVPSRSA